MKIQKLTAAAVKGLARQIDLRFVCFLEVLLVLSVSACSHSGRPVAKRAEQIESSQSKILAVRNEMQDGFGAITGRVVDAKTGQPLPGANVSLEAAKLGAATDFYGIYKISRVPPGTYLINCAYIGFVPHKRKDLVVAPNKTVILDVYLTPVPGLGCPVIKNK